nr:hypothetical protein [Myxococcus sp. AM011]
MEDALEMARALVDLGFSTVAPSPHARPEYAPVDVVEARLVELKAALEQARIPLSLGRNAENILDDAFLRGPCARTPRTARGAEEQGGGGGIRPPPPGQPVPPSGRRVAGV